MANKLSYKNVSNLIVAIAAIVVVLMLIFPLPVVLLDFFMALNLLFSIIILLIVLYTSRAIDFSSFPTILLISTIFGLGLNVCSTRLILGQGAKFNGKMIKAFSSFVVGGAGQESLVIGFIIFIIIIAVQTFVITKGATRVAEVGARFTLDSMQPKQMAIEAEFNSGAISEEEAKKRKKELQMEIDFYGNMDGATKFVSNNVKVGIFITVINLLGGLIIGIVMHNMDFRTALSTYASFTIGDGLLTQMPSLLVSFATGLIVTRSASDENTTLGDDIKSEFSRNGVIYYIAGATMIIMGLLPGFPKMVLFLLGGSLIYLGYIMQKASKSEVIAKKGMDSLVTTEDGKQASSQPISPVVPLDLLSLELGLANLPLIDLEKGGNLKERMSRIRRDIGLDLGLVVPPIRMNDNMTLDSSEYVFKIKGVEVERGKLRLGCLLAMNTGGITEDIQGEKTQDPVFGLPAIWITEDAREKAERSGYSVVDAPTIITTHITEMIRHHAAEILGRQEVKAIVETLRKDYPAVVEDVEKMEFTIGDIQKVMQGLLREQVSVRNMVTILETMADFGKITKNTDTLVEEVRQRLGRQICFQYADENKVLRVVTVEHSFLQRLVDSRVDTINGPVAALKINEQHAWIAAINGTYASVSNKGYQPIVLCPKEARILVKETTRRELPGLVVLSVGEIVDDIKVESLGEIHVQL
ncbi:MAG: flagellar biosynthesis protein FlhA [Treponema sp.]|nr:flagellar biosynthesis protein FlhA [Treponema sp.]